MTPTLTTTTRPRPAVRASAGSPATRRLETLAPLSDEEFALVLGLGSRPDTYGPGQEIVPQGGPIRRARLVLDGWACRLRTLADGRRQIIGFLIPGDMIGLSHKPGPLELCATVALTRTQCLDATPLKDAIAREAARWPGLAAALRRGARAEEGQLLDHITRLGRQTAYERVAHLLLELHARLTVAGLATGPAFPMPLTQETLADALGLSVVHVNRILQQLRREKLVELRAGRAVLLQPDLLAGIADFRGAEL
jgi:CRP-like cAMP-binding protein